MALLFILRRPDSPSGGSEGTQFITLQVTDRQFDGAKAFWGEVPTPNQNDTTKGSRIVDRGYNKVLITLSGVISAYGGFTAAQRDKQLRDAYRSWWATNSGWAYLVGLEGGETLRVAINSYSSRAVYPEVSAGEQIFSFVIRLVEVKVT